MYAPRAHLLYGNVSIDVYIHFVLRIIKQKEKLESERKRKREKIKVQKYGDIFLCVWVFFFIALHFVCSEEEKLYTVHGYGMQAKQRKASKRNLNRFI